MSSVSISRRHPPYVATGPGTCRPGNRKSLPFLAAKAADGIRDLARLANRPFFVLGGYLIGTGAIGGYVIDAPLLGRVTGATVLRLLKNPTAAVAPPPPGPATQWVFDPIQLRRWNLAGSPSNSTS